MKTKRPVKEPREHASKQERDGQREKLNTRNHEREKASVKETIGRKEKEQSRRDIKRGKIV